MELVVVALNVVVEGNGGGWGCREKEGVGLTRSEEGG